MYTAILLPGLDGTGELFSPFVKAAPSEVQIVVVKYPSDEYSMDVLEHYARSKLVNRCIIVAESFSGPIGVRLAADPRVRALILCNSFVTRPFALSVRHLAAAPLFAIPLPKLRGSEDSLISEKSWQGINELRPDASVVTLKGPHMLLQTLPRECWNAISQFIDRGIF